MKKQWKIFVMTAITFCTAVPVHPASAQSAEIEQLILDVEKLTQFKQILSDMKTGYEIFDKGYSAVRDISQGNFSLHEAFIEGLLLVNPTIAKYRRVGDIISDEASILSEYKAAYSYFKNSDRFTQDGLDYLSKVYGNLFNRSLNDLDQLTTVLTAGKLRMSDDERLSEINRIYIETHGMLSFLQGFDDKVGTLNLQWIDLQRDANDMGKLTGIKK